MATVRSFEVMSDKFDVVEILHRNASAKFEVLMSLRPRHVARDRTER